jgi:hypothetical protein
LTAAFVQDGGVFSPELRLDFAWTNLEFETLANGMPIETFSDISEISRNLAACG